VMALARFAEEDRLNAAAGAESFLDEPDPLNADATGFRGQAAAEGHAKGLQPAIVAAGQERKFAGRFRVTRSFACGGHTMERNKF